MDHVRDAVHLIVANVSITRTCDALVGLAIRRKDAFKGNALEM